MSISRKIRSAFIVGTAFAAVSFAVPASAATFPSIGSNTAGPALIITINANGTTTISNGPSATVGPYDGSDDTYIGVINNSSASVGSLALVSNNDAFGFEGDGISNSTFGAPGNAIDTTGYGGPLAFFTNIVPGTYSSTDSGTVNFIGGLAPGASTYFSLENALTTANFTAPPVVGGGVPEPATWAMMLLGFGAIAVSVRRRTNRTTTALV